MPRVSVIMSTRNTPEIFLKESIESILNQTFQDFEFIIINDGSDDFNIKQFFKGDVDPRIRIINNRPSVGLTKSLNKGLAVSLGEYIVRMDSDDRSDRKRIEEQVAYMANHLDVVAAGSWFRKIGNVSKVEKCRIPDMLELQKVSLLFGNLNIAHPSVIIRGNVLRKNNIMYNERYSKAQDYDLWTQLVNFGKIAIIPKILLEYRIHDKQVSTEFKSAQEYCAAEIRIDRLRTIGLEPTEEQKKIHLDYCSNRIPHIPSNTRKWIDIIKGQNKKINYFDVGVLNDELEYKWFQICYNAFIIQKDIKFKHAYKEAFTFKQFVRQKELLVKRSIIDILQYRLKIQKKKIGQR